GERLRPLGHVSAGGFIQTGKQGQAENEPPALKSLDHMWDIGNAGHEIMNNRDIPWTCNSFFPTQ
ncbi:MAG: hypothetical protein R3256_14390, partial [Thalassovita sp.]|nr:hypothetical protein [Thalassovita sp.]